MNGVVPLRSTKSVAASSSMDHIYISREEVGVELSVRRAGSVGCRSASVVVRLSSEETP